MVLRCRVGSRVCLTQSNAGSTLLLLGPDAARQESPNACISSTKECRFTAVDSLHLSIRFRNAFQRASQAPTPFNSMTYAMPYSPTRRAAQRFGKRMQKRCRVGSRVCLTQSNAGSTLHLLGAQCRAPRAPESLYFSGYVALPQSPSSCQGDLHSLKIFSTQLRRRKN